MLGDGGGRREVGETALVGARSEAAGLVRRRGTWLELRGREGSGAATRRRLFGRRRSCSLEGGGGLVAGKESFLPFIGSCQETEENDSRLSTHGGMAVWT